MKRLIMLSTGGTIASQSTEHGLVPQVSGNVLLNEVPELSALAYIDCKEILQLDSSNMTPDHWKCIAIEVYHSLKEYDGVVITHGTDTMAYTACALSFFLQELNRPVILTGSQIPMGEEGSDAKGNLLDAFRVASSGIKGVYVVFGGRIIPGLCAKKMYTENLKAFESINEEYVGTIKNGMITWNLELVDEANCGNEVTFTDTSSSDKAMISENTPDLSLDLTLDSRVMVLKLLPGIDSNFLINVMKMGYRGIILEAFGCGGVPNQEMSILPALEYAKQEGIVVVIASQCVYDGVRLDVYDVGVRAQRYGAISGGIRTIEALYVQMMWVLGHSASYEEACLKMKGNI